MFGFLIVFLILTAVGVYYFLNLNSKFSSDLNVQKKTETQKINPPTVTPSLEEDLKSIDVATDDADIIELQGEVRGL